MFWWVLLFVEVIGTQKWDSWGYCGYRAASLQYDIYNYMKRLFMLIFIINSISSSFFKKKYDHFTQRINLFFECQNNTSYWRTLWVNRLLYMFQLVNNLGFLKAKISSRYAFVKCGFQLKYSPQNNIFSAKHLSHESKEVRHHSVGLSSFP